MRLHSSTLLCSIALLATLLAESESRRIRVRPLPQEEEDDPTIQYYSADPREDAQQQEIVYITSSDQYNGLYGQQQANPRVGSSRDNYIQQVKSPARTKEHSRAPPVQTIRNYNKVNDDGSFTFGYEAADGSFKEETRGTDCVVRGKYGYVDPDGNKREFTYVSGNPCDPNAPKDDDLDDKPDDKEADSGPANYPTRPIRPVRPKPAVTLYQSNYGQEEDEQPEPEQVLRPVQARRPSPVYITRQQYADEDEEVYQRPRLLNSVSSTTPASVVYKHSLSPINITPRPVTSSSGRSEPPTTYRPQLVQVAVTPRPAILYTKQIASPRPIGLGAHTTATPVTVSRVNGGGIDFDAEFQKFQQENNILAPTPSTLLKQSSKSKAPSASGHPSGQIYSSELVYDPSSGQYNTQLYQTLPQSAGDFTLSHRIQPYVHNPQPNPLVSLQTLQQQSPLYRQPLRPLNQALYQQQQSELQFQNSAQLYAQQQKARSQQAPATGQQYYYVQPSLQQPQGYHGGQIDAFLRGHNIQFK